MIVINVYWLQHIGMPTDIVMGLLETRGLMFTALDTFAAGFTGGRFSSALWRDTLPRTLLLVGVSDRHGIADGIGAVIELGIDGHDFRRLSEPETVVLLEHLDSIDHPSARAIATAVRTLGEEAASCE
jgi:hypothetical protein